MMPHIGAIATQVTSALHMTDIVEIEVPSTTGWVTLSTNTYANVQQPRGDTSRTDPNEARADEYRAIIVYIARIAGLVGLEPRSLVGGRLTWRGAHYEIATDDGERSHGQLRRLACSREQTGTAPELVAFARRSRLTGLVTDLGTYVCHVTLDQRGGYEVSLSGGSSSDTQTASGDSVTGVVVIMNQSGAQSITIGDVFAYHDMPGRIATEDRSDPDRLEFGVVIARGTT